MVKQKKRSRGSPIRRGAGALEQEGIHLFNKGEFGKAVVVFSKALQQDRDNPRLLFNLGSAFQRVAEHDLAVKAFRAALLKKPRYAAAYNNLGLSLAEMGQHESAANAFQQAIDADPSLFEAFGNLGNALRTAGLLEDAADAYRRAMMMNPRNAEVHRAHILTRIYDPKVSNEALFALARAYENRHAPSEKVLPHDNEPNPERRIRIGYLSSDFRDHPAGHNLAPLFFNHDRSRFETFIYAELSTRDFMTDAFRDAADHFQLTPGMKDREIAQMIRRDRIDILVFLAGYLDANRSLIAALKPAPVQVSYHDVATSGLSAMDYWISDAYCSPRKSTERFTERLIRVPRLLVYRPIENAPSPSPPPCLEKGFITFGSMNNPAKLNEKVIGLFARTLLAIPDSRLLLKYSGTFDSAVTRDRFLSRFNAHGVEASRVAFRHGREGRAAHLSHYRDVDIALDTFPFNGVTTTFEALWMGVPVVTLPGDRFISRAAASILRTIGFDAGIAANEEAYVQRAMGIAADTQGLSTLRGSLRDIMRASPLMDEKQYAYTMERVLTAMWRQWCKRRRYSESENQYGV
jgi:protein O-GlcNAc transferase